MTLLAKMFFFLQNSGMFWQSTLVAEADPADFLLRLQKKLSSTHYKGDESWVKAIEERNKAAEDKNKLRGEEPTDQHLNPIKVLQTLEEVLPENSILVADGGDFVATAAYVTRY